LELRSLPPFAACGNGTIWKQ